MTRTVIRVLRVRNGKDNLVVLEQHPDTLLAGGSGVDDSALELRITPADAPLKALEGCPGPMLVRQAGRHLYRSLVRHRPIGTVLGALATLQPARPGAADAQEYPIFFRVDSPELEGLPWEALCDPHDRFFSVDDHRQSYWPIGRIPSAARHGGAAERSIGPAPRVTLVLAAAGIPAAAHQAEFDAVCGALASTGAAVQLLTSDAALLEHARRFTPAPASLEPHFIGTADELLTQIDLFQPNLVHFFCHGSSGDRPQLELETRIDRELGNPGGSLLLNATALLPLARCASVWLVTLNCCKGALATTTVRSVAHDLAAAGTPAVLAMREEIRVDDAPVFSRLFYTRLATETERYFRAQPDALEDGRLMALDDVVWTRSLRDGRQELIGHVGERNRGDPGIPSPVLDDPAGCCAEWTYPVLYLHSGGLTLQARPAPRTLDPADAAELRSELDLLRKLQETWSRSAPDGQARLREQVEARIRAVEDELYGTRGAAPDAPHPDAP